MRTCLPSIASADRGKLHSVNWHPYRLQSCPQNLYCFLYNDTYCGKSRSKAKPYRAKRFPCGQESEERNTGSIETKTESNLTSYIAKQFTILSFLQFHSAITCKARWTSMRDYFMREKGRSGQAASSKKKWPFYDSMLFLVPYITPRDTSGNWDPLNLRCHMMSTAGVSGMMILLPWLELMLLKNQVPAVPCHS